MKEFYKKANSLLKIKRSNPVVTKVQKEDELGETQRLWIILSHNISLTSTKDPTTGDNNLVVSISMSRRMKK